MSSRVPPVGLRLQRLLALLQWVAGEPEGVEVAAACQRFAMSETELLTELQMATMIGDGSAEFDDMPFLVIIEGSHLEASLLSFQRPLRVTEAEGMALLASAGVLVDGSTDPEDPLSRALHKLADHLGVTLGESIDVDLDHDGGAVGRLLAQAIGERRRVSFTYWSYGRDAVESRLVDPWRLISNEGEWYLSGLDVTKEASRRFRLDRIDDLVLTDQRAGAAPRKPDTMALPEDAPMVVVDVDASMRWIAEAYPVHDVVTDPHTARTRVTLAVTGISWLERTMLRLGPQAWIVEVDPRLGDETIPAAAASRVLERYTTR